METIKQEQKGGKESTNIQVANVNNFQGIGYNDVKCICRDLFEQNFITLKNEALEVVQERIEIFNNKYIDKLIDEKIENISELKKPDMQFVLYEAQKSYARNGGNNLLEILVSILAERTKESNESLLNLNYNEALTIIPKITSEQMDLLTLVFLLRYTCNNSVKCEETLKSYLKTYILPFSDISNIKNSTLKYMTYLGCGNVLVGDKLELILSKTYPEVFENKNIKQYMINLVPEIGKVFGIWDGSELHCFDLTSIGILIGHANLKMKTGINPNLSIWI
ncbi:LPO_1073/Vpar_1526 family protein [Paraclostridium dentum]|uniref:LPO_1073/Vpar_1526 family protein n=1 Tax=Paraclostridium dentum TaxID=2662455 RepID=UPI003AFF98C3